MKKETLQEYLARGGKITMCPPKEKKQKRSSSKRKLQGPDYDTRSQEGTPIDMDLVPEALKISLGFNK